ncbi:unnamed protein product [Tuber melanosporum]|uniref:(Perigord truffle) hypothetical protein n=1 Tax=Tuber melanosporum (strain Mel28) TaxID=656061 RepID=D5GBB2_TUBMM|nr:uncharacterized protein GSTUM_00000400001 [Tuber melanosporum]CAZ81805.1 unnamed protein product [Tuber melanosporum]
MYSCIIAFPPPFIRPRNSNYAATSTALVPVRAHAQFHHASRFPNYSFTRASIIAANASKLQGNK